MNNHGRFNPQTATIKELEMHIKTIEVQLKLLERILKLRKQLEEDADKETK